MKSNLVIAIVALLLIGGTAGLLVRMKATQKLGRPGVKLIERPGTNGTVVALPESVPNFVSKEIEVSDSERAVLPKDTVYGKRAYQAPDGFVVYTTVVLMGTDRTSIHRPEFCLTGQGWNIDSKKPVTVPMQSPRPYDLPAQLFTASRNLRLNDGTIVPARALYLFWFVADDALTASHWTRQWSMAEQLLKTGTLQRWAYVSLLSLCAPGQEEAAFARLKQFAVAAVPEFQLTTGEPAGTAQTADARKVLNEPKPNRIN